MQLRSLCATVTRRHMRTIALGRSPPARRQHTMTAHAAESPPQLVVVGARGRLSLPSTAASRGRDEAPTHLSVDDWALCKGEHHVVLGVNGAGKTLFLDHLQRAASRAGTAGMGDDAHTPGGAPGMLSVRFGSAPSIATVSFAHHAAFVAEHGQALVKDAIGGLRGNEDLIVMFGLYALWYKPVHVLSNGEVRKVMLARAVAQRPQVLVLNKPFDGLDKMACASLRDLVNDLAVGLVTPLIAGLQQRDRSGTHVLLVTHRPDEVPPSISHLTRVANGIVSSAVPLPTAADARLALITDALGGGTTDTSPSWSIKWAAGMGLPTPVGPKARDPLFTFDACRLQVGTAAPPDGNVNRGPTPAVERGQARRSGHAAAEARVRQQLPVVTVVAQCLTWSMLPAQTVALLGHNGAGKTTLTRLLEGKRLSLDAVTTEEDRHRVTLPSPRSVQVVSTDSHLRALTELGAATVESCLVSAFQCREDGARPQAEAATDPAIVAMAESLGVLPCMARPFIELSQGQQKLVLVARAVLANAPLLVMDEVTQGLDLINRRRVLALLRHVCASTGTALLYVTHHEDELRHLASFGRPVHVYTLGQGNLTLGPALRCDGDDA